MNVCIVLHCLTFRTTTFYQSKQLVSNKHLVFRIDVLLINKKNNVEFDERLDMPLSFVCNLLKVAKKDFASLAISNLLDEELDWISNNGHKIKINKIQDFKRTVKKVKTEANGWIINKENSSGD